MKKIFLVTIFLITNFILISFSKRNIHVSGRYVPELAAVDEEVIAFMKRWKIPGGAVALVKDGKIVYSRGFGKADENVYTQADHLFRIASLSKPITSAAIMKLVEEGKISTDSKVFGEQGILAGKYGKIKDPRITKITVRDLLQHTAGWDRDGGACGDPMFDCKNISQCMNISTLPDPETIIRYMMRKDLDFEPGSNYAYSNFGYTVLGRIIEKISGMKYEEYVKQCILKPAGITSMQLAGNLYCDRKDNEVMYYDLNGKQLVSSVCEPGKKAPHPYGGFNIEAMDAHGGWIASAADLAKFISSIEGSQTAKRILNKGSVKNMLLPSEANPNYAMGWFVNPRGSYWHTGCLVGSSAMMAHINNGISWVILFNAYPDSDNYFKELDRLMWNALAKVHSWPE
ncbi:MAG: beta-lactamase family protein [Cytophagaceae bacterium]|nr:beta-lactamase family protein [Cytophagaceae bacterium]